jgi:hypothetical protein
MRRISPELETPWHFKGFARDLEAAIFVETGGPDQEVGFAFSAPPQHGKSEVCKHAIVLACLAYPARNHAYVTFNQEKVRGVSREVQELLRRAGIRFTGTLHDIQLSTGGSIRFVSIDRGLTGEPVNGLCLIDDPYKDEAEASSKARREAVETAWRTTFVPRLHPTGRVAVLCTRWHPSDFIAYLKARGWRHVNLPAIAEEDDPLGRPIGAPLWESQRPLWFLEGKRKDGQVGELGFQQQYQGRPRNRGAGVFREPARYSVLPTSGYRVAFGSDLAYTESTKADWSVLIELWRVENWITGPDGKPLDQAVFYVVDVVRRQCEIGDFAAEIRRALERRPAAPLAWRCAGTERGSGSLLKRPPYNLPLMLKTPPGDKYQSALAVSTAWNQGRVLIPDAEFFPWIGPPDPYGQPQRVKVQDFVNRFLDFTGAKNGEVDDEIDALGTGHILLPAPPSTGPVGKPRSKTW